ncbi:MAG: Formate hydrogenlyase subunit 4 [Lentisphaerae bacterium ADurb.Bin242]|nr:MAG: Formate hydrogenlyase subunit 4 [Lentisphaerae bacterium ADurb.Bin242]
MTMNFQTVFNFCRHDPYISSILLLLLTPVLGGLLQGLDRKITARMQGRFGPPLLQPFYDIIKLFGKEPMALHRPQTVYATLHLVFMMVAVVLLAQGSDLLMVLFVQAFSVICLVLGGMSVRSPYSWIGSQRKILLMLALEPILLLLILAVNLKTNSFLGESVLKLDRPLLLSMPLLFLAFLCVVAIEWEKSPFDLATSHHAHQEIVKGITLEYSGPFLGLIEIAHCYEVAFFFGLMMAFWHTNLLFSLLLAAGGFMGLILLDNAFSRLTPTWVLRYMWTVPLSLALVNLIWLWE